MPELRWGLRLKGREGGRTSRISNRRVTIFSFLEERWVLGFDERASVCVYNILGKMERFCIVNKESIAFQEKLLKVERNKTVCWCGILTFETTSLRRKLKGVDPTIRTTSNGKKWEKRITLFHRGLNSPPAWFPSFLGPHSTIFCNPIENQNLASRLHSFYHLLERSPDKNAS